MKLWGEVGWGMGMFVPYYEKVIKTERDNSAVFWITTVHVITRLIK